MKNIFYIAFLFTFIGMAQDGPILNPYNFITCTDPNAANTNTEIITGDVRAFCGNEANVTPDWGAYTPVNATYSNVAIATVYGDYMAKMVATGSSYGRTRNRFTTDGSSVYDYVFVYKKSQGNKGRLQFAVNATGTDLANLSATDWTVLTGTFTATGTSVEIDTWCQTSTGGSAGDDMWYKLSIKLH